MANLNTCPKDGTKIELYVLQRGPAVGEIVPEGRQSGWRWVTGHFDFGDARWVFDYEPPEGATVDSTPLYWRKLGQTARIAAKQKSVKDQWVVTNGDPEFFEERQSYWVMIRGGELPILVAVTETFMADDPNGWLIGWAGYNETQTRQNCFTIKASDVWAARREPHRVTRPNIAEPIIYAEV